jgi:SAM-dependent methyltransferase
MPVNDDDVKQRRASSFGAVAAAYAAHRPDYPEEAIRWALAPALTTDGSRDTAGMVPGNEVGGSLAGMPVLDLGAGTGKLTAQLAALGAAVTAVEPDPSMLAELRRRLPSVQASGGSAESIPLPDGSVRAVLCGQSLHWFNLERALPEIARVLAPGGVLAGLWNNDDDRVEWVAGLHEAAEGTSSPALTARRSAAAVLRLGDTPQFTREESAEFPYGQRRTAESLVATISTHSKFLIMPLPEQERVSGRLRAYLRSRPETSAGEFTLPMVTVVLRTIRNG